MDENDELIERQDDRRWRYRGSLFFPLILIAIGILFLLSNTGTISSDPWDIIVRFWPVFLIVMGLDGLLRGEGIVGAGFILAVGVILLLSNLGLLAVDVWSAAVRLWPLLLVAVGLDLLVGRRSRVGAVLSMVVLVAILIGALWLMGTGFQSGVALESERIEQALEGAEEARIDIEMGMGRLQLDALSDGDSLVTGAVEMPNRGEIRQDYSLQGNAAVFRLRDAEGLNNILPGRTDDRQWDLAVAQSIPLDLDISLGAGEMVLDLTGLLINSLNVDIGVGETQVSLPDTGSFEGTVSGAIGKIEINVPPEVGLRVEAGTAISSVDIPDDYARNDRVYTSPNYDSAEFKIELDLSQAIGRMEIVEQ